MSRHPRTQKTEYPPEWRSGERQIQIRTLAGHQCEWCGMRFQEGTNLAMSEYQTRHGRDGKLYPMIGTVHHINGRKHDLRWENLVYLCQRCHLRTQWTWEPGQVIPWQWIREAKGIPHWIEVRRLAYQLDYRFPEPARLVQKELFRVG